MPPKPDSFIARVLISPIRRRYSGYLQILMDIRDGVNELKILVSVCSSETVKNHLANLGSPAKVDPQEFSSIFASASGRVQPYLVHQGSSNKIALCSVVVGESYAQMIGPCLESHAAYCQRHGYDYLQLRECCGWPARHPSWYKIPLIDNLLQKGYDKVAFVDADALITNPRLPLDPHFDALDKENKAINLAEDEGSVNCGVLFVRNCPDARRILDLIWLHDSKSSIWEQAALKMLLERDRRVRQLVEITEPANAFNSYPPERETILNMTTRQLNNWKRGDFICHFAGIRPPRLIELIEAYQRDSLS